jgi:hypothetical protein
MLNSFIFQAESGGRRFSLNLMTSHINSDNYV